MDKKPPIYTLSEIAEWAEKKIVSLPTVQRGFVWKPSQVENLWDSLLRGYPIGAFVMSPKKDGSFEMLDGQQRATAICLGFGRDTFRDSQDKVKVFIDLERPGADDNRKFFFRVITKAHPWGYQLTDNTKTLSSDNKRHAMNMYGVDDFLETDLANCFPYDASFPIPLYYFLKAAQNNETEDQLLAQIQNWPLWNKVKEEWFKWRKENKSLSDYDESNKLSTLTQIEKRISEIFVLVKEMIDTNTGQQVPALYLDFDRFKKQVNDDNRRSDTDRSKAMDDSKEDEEENEATDEIENLFIRLNAGGTPLRGEELNYSILKAHISPELQDKIETACEGFFQPARFITIVYRLYQHCNGRDSWDSLSMRIKPKQFQKSVNRKKDRIGFVLFIEELLEKNKYHSKSKTLLNYSRFILEYNKEYNTYGLPYLLIIKITETAPEIMFLLLYRILKMKDEFEFNNDLHRQMLGMITLFMWLGKGERRRDYSKLLSNIWPCVEKMDMKLFWSSSAVSRAMLYKVLTPFPTYNKRYDRDSLWAILNKVTPKPKTNPLLKIYSLSDYGDFVYKMLWNDDLILYAQREFLSAIFREKEHYLDDTNAPFDWDHISPYKLQTRKGLPNPIKDFYNTIGNRRAWPYSLNRTDQDSVPAIKLNPLRGSTVQIEKLEEIEKSWDLFISKHNDLIKYREQLSDCILSWSKCSTNWLKCEVDDLKYGNWKMVYQLINERSLSIIEDWYNSLRIESLIPNNKKSEFINFVDKRKWDLNPRLNSDIQELFNSKEFDYLVSTPVEVGKTEISFYITFSDEDLLENNAINFGIMEHTNLSFIRTLKIPDREKDNYDTDNRRMWIEGSFTLISTDKESYLELFKAFKAWINKLKKFSKNVTNDLGIIFIESLVASFKQRLENK